MMIYVVIFDITRPVEFYDNEPPGLFSSSVSVCALEIQLHQEMMMRKGRPFFN